MRRFSGALGLLLLLSCGPRSPMSGRGSVLWWAITQAQVQFVDCTDEPTFRSNFATAGLSDGGVIAYKLAADGNSATLEDCSVALDPATCSDTANVFQVAGDDLLLNQSLTTPITGAQCSLTDARIWDLLDKGPTLEIRISDDLGLAGDAGSCAQVDTSEKMASTNGFGIQGCVVNYPATASYDGP